MDITPNNGANGKVKLCSGFGDYARLGFLLFLLVLFSVFLPAFCRETSALEKTEYILAAYPANDPKKVFYAIKPLADHISSKTGWEVRAVVTRNYEEMVQRLTDGSVDMGLMSSSSYVRFARSIPGLSYIATYMEMDEGGEISPFYRSVIIAMKSSQLKTAEDLQGKRFGFTNTYSTSGYVIPAAMLSARGIDPRTFLGKIFFIGRHDAVVEALRAGSVDAGAVSDGALATARRHYGDIFREIAVSEPIPLDAFVAGATVPRGHREILREILISLSPDSVPMEAFRRNLDWPAAGFRALDDSFYDPLRRAMGIRTEK
ncbi:MAG: phosphate/phosphite/phosphonate ABC transporter substrate-binding protein [Aminobacteriaceae bacterium]